MIYKFDRYVLRTIILHFLATLFFLLMIDFLVQFSDQSGMINDTNFPALLLVYTLILEIPNRIIEFTPAAILVATIMGFGQLSAQNEITIVRTCGTSRLRLSLPSIFLAFFIGIIITLIGELIAPITTHKSETLVAQTTGKPININLQKGLWIQDANHIIYIKNLNNDGTLGNLNFYTLDSNGNIAIQKSRLAEYQNNQWSLKDNQRIDMNSQAVQYTTAQSIWQSRLTPAEIARYAQTDNASTIEELLNLKRFLSANQLNTDETTLKLWQRILLPLTTVTMVLLALPFAFNTKRNGFGGRLVIGIMLGVAYYFVQGILAKSFLLFNWPPILGASLPILIFAIPPIILLRKD